MFAQQEPSAAGSAKTVLLSAELFQAQLHRERARADRTGSEFVVLTFDVEYGAQLREVETPLRNTLAESVSQVFRLCDTKGWHIKNGGTVGVIMPETTEQEAVEPLRRTERAFARLFKRRFAGEKVPPRLVCMMHSYPASPNDDHKELNAGELDLSFKKFANEQVPVGANGGTRRNGHAQD